MSKVGLVARYLIYDDALGIVLSSHAVASSTTVEYGCVHGTKGVKPLVVRSRTMNHACVYTHIDTKYTFYY